MTKVSETIREQLVKFHGEDAGKFFDESQKKDQKLRVRVKNGEDFDKVFEEMYPVKAETVLNEKL